MVVTVAPAPVVRSIERSAATRRFADDGPVATRRRTIHTLLRRHRRTRSGELDRDHPFSWSRCLLSVFSYALLLSDVLRTGIGIRTMADYTSLEPDTVVYFGPYAYPVQRLTAHDEQDDGVDEEDAPVPFWAYKYDTTSISLRAVVQGLGGLPSWPGCVLYRGTCDETRGLPRTTVFGMLDGLLDAVAGHHRGHVTLRAEVNWYDRLYHYVFPWVFQRSVHRTIQGIHYDDRRLRSPHTRLCGGSRSAVRHHEPLSCAETWPVYHRVCERRNPEYGLCAHVDNVWSHITRRYQALAAAHPNRTIELLILETLEDISPPSPIYHGRKITDIVSLLRVRDCPMTTSTDSAARGDCTTLLIDDYRYESEILTTSVSSWFPIVAAIRVLGQVYAFARLALLVGGCYVARASDKYHSDATVAARLLTALKTVFLIPSQVVIYGSVFPIACYVVAHLLDSALVYDLMARKFNSILGNYHIDLFAAIKICAVSMRSVWVAAIVCHVILAALTSRSWSPLRGIPGIREFALSAIASLTVFAQVRAISWRNTRVVSTHELIPSLRQLRIRGFAFDNSHDFWHQLFFGTTIDPQCLSASFLLLTLVAIAAALVHRVIPGRFPFRISLFSQTPVPYGAKSLWLTNALVIAWYGPLLAPTRPSLTLSPALQRSRSPRPSSIKQIHVGTRDGHGETYTASFPRPTTRTGSRRQRTTTESQLGQLERFILATDRCPPRVESMIYLINLAAMTDPITFVRLRLLGGRRLALYESRSTGRCVLLPYGCAASEADLPLDWDDLELLMVINTRDLHWWDLLQCG